MQIMYKKISKPQWEIMLSEMLS